MAAQIELFTKGNNPYYGQFIKARKEEGRLYVTVARSQDVRKRIVEENKKQILQDTEITEKRAMGKPKEQNPQLGDNWQMAQN